MVNDVIADSITRIRNAGLRRLDTATLMFSKTVESILQVFVEKGFIESYKVVEDKRGIKSITVVLKYDDKGYTVINEVQRVSKPGRRVYKGYRELKKFKNGYGSIVVSTSKGVIDNESAYGQKVGGEALVSIW